MKVEIGATGLFCESCQQTFAGKKKSQRFCSRSCANRSRSKVDHSFFSTPTILNSYYAGFIAADGCILEPDGGSPVLQVSLKGADGEFLSKMLEVMGSDLQVRHSSYQNNFGLHKRASISITSKQIAEDLDRNFNISPRKTLTLQPPVGLDRECSLAYIAGLIDGDGSYSYSKRNNRPILNILGTEELLRWVRNIVGCGAIRQKGNIHLFSCEGDASIRMRSLYIDMPLPFLERKYRRWESLGLNLEFSNVGVYDHGMIKMYEKRGCRCDKCVAAWDIYHNSKRPVQNCQECTTPFQPKRARAKFCSLSCSAANRERKKREA